MNPTVSVIIPTYNRANLIERAIRSVLSQTHRDFEIIIVDDASTDNTQEMLKEKFKQEIDSGTLRIIRNDTNMERSRSRNRGMEMAGGEYIALLDDDDIWLPDHLKILAEYLQESSDLGCVFSNFAIVSTGSVEMGVRKLSHYKQFSDRELCILGVLSATCTALFKKDAYKKTGGFREDLNRGENREFYSRMALNYPIKFVNIVTCCQYAHRGSYSSITPEEYAYSREKLWKMNEENSIRCEFPLRKELIGRGYMNLSWYFLSNTQKAKEYLLKSVKADYKLIGKWEAWSLFFRVAFGQNIYRMMQRGKRIFR